VTATGELALITVYEPQNGFYCIDNTPHGQDTWVVHTNFADRIVVEDHNPGAPPECNGYPTDLLVRTWNLSNVPTPAGFTLAIL
jgi:hypothetical protein